MNTASKADRALALCKEYDRLLCEISRNRDEISRASEKCDRMVTYSGGPLGKGVSYNAVPDGGNTCIGDVFEGYLTDSNFEPERRYYTETEALEIIGDCEGCMKVYLAVQARKANRMKLGAVKRSIRALGRIA